MISTRGGAAAAGPVVPLVGAYDLLRSERRGSRGARGWRRHHTATRGAAAGPAPELLDATVPPRLDIELVTGPQAPRSRQLGASTWRPGDWVWDVRWATYGGPKSASACEHASASQRKDGLLYIASPVRPLP